MQYVVVTAHESKYPNPVRFEPGDPLTLGRRDDEYPGWVRVVTAAGVEGWAPEAYVRADAPGAGVATHAYTARELDTRVGEHLTCTRELCGWRWVENDRGASGWVPAETVQPC